MNEQIRILQLIDSLQVGGAEVLAVNIANALSNEGVESHLCVTRNEGPLKEYIEPAVQYLFLKRKKTVDIKSIYKLKNYIKYNNISIIHAHSTSYFIAICVKLILPKLKVIWHNHTGNYVYIRGLKLVFFKSCTSYVDYIISVNKDLDFWSKTILKNVKGSCIKNFPVFMDLRKSTVLKGAKRNRIVHVAGFRKPKDHLTLLNAFKIILNQEPTSSLHLIGKVYKGIYSDSIKTFISDHNLSKYVFLYDVRSDIKNILDQADIGVLSSDSEGLPISLLEYGLAKLPVVVTNVGDCAAVVTNKQVVVPPKRSDKLADAIVCLIKDQELRDKVAFDLHAEVLKNYAIENSIKKIIKIYTTLI